MQLNDPSYLGVWLRHESGFFSWRTLSGTLEFTAETLQSFLKEVVHREDLFFAIEKWERAGYIGGDTPESYECKSLYDKAEPLMNCMFPNQDARCWNTKWLGG